MKVLNDAARLARGRGATGSRWRRPLGLGIAAVVCACQASTIAAHDKGRDTLPRRETEVTHARCDTEGMAAQALDANGDGRADVTVGQGGRGPCQAYDLNLDGGIDVWVYEDGAGHLVRRELDFARDGVPDETQLFSAGSPTERHLSTIVPGRLDTWHFYRAGKLVRTERDTNGDGIIDQWWMYPKPGCPVIQSDTDADGQPNPDSTIDLCALGEVPRSGRDGGERSDPRAFERPGLAPAEVEQRDPQPPIEPTQSKGPAAATAPVGPTHAPAGDGQRDGSKAIPSPRRGEP